MTESPAFLRGVEVGKRASSFNVRGMNPYPVWTEGGADWDHGFRVGYYLEADKKRVAS
jgi:hypothetical protein